MRIIKSNLSESDKSKIRNMEAKAYESEEIIDTLLDFASETTMELCMMELGLEEDFNDNV